MKVCAKCKHSVLGDYQFVCFHPNLSKVNTVTGIEYGTHCYFERASPIAECGTDGKLYEEKQSLIQQFLNLLGGLK